MKNVDLANVEEAKEYVRLGAGGYICKITKAEDVPDREYLRIEYDIAQGDFKDYFKDLFEAKNFWGGKLIKSYKVTALSFFKAFITAVEKSNAKFKFDNDETKLVGKLVGLVLGEEGYIGNDGSSKSRLYVKEVRSIDVIKNGEFEVPLYKPCAGESTYKSAPVADNNGFMNIPDGIDEELPFH
jgi:hypothetical protein